MLESFREIGEYREFLREFVLMQLRTKYRGSLLGLMWVFLTPLLLCLSFGFIFSYVNRMDLTDYLPFFLAGYMPWIFFVSVGTMANQAIVGNASYVTRAYTPRAIFPLSVVMVQLPELLTGLLSAIAIIAFVAPHKLSASLLFLPIAAALLLVFVTGVSFLFATLNVFFRDWSFAWGTLSFVWFFVTPILWTMSNIPPRIQTLFALNIFYPFVRMFQDPMAWGTLPPAEIVMTASLYAIIVFILGTGAFFRWQRQFYMYV